MRLRIINTSAWRVEIRHHNSGFCKINTIGCTYTFSTFVYIYDMEKYTLWGATQLQLLTTNKFASSKKLSTSIRAQQAFTLDR